MYLLISQNNLVNILQKKKKTFNRFNKLLLMSEAFLIFRIIIVYFFDVLYNIQRNNY